VSIAFAMRGSCYRRYLRRYARTIRILAVHLAEGDRDLRDDLEQEARIKLWHLDLRRVRGGKGRYIRKTLYYAMFNFRLHYTGRLLDGRFVRFPERAA
jgi:hypothetical protein